MQSATHLLVFSAIIIVATFVVISVYSDSLRDIIGRTQFSSKNIENVENQINTDTQPIKNKLLKNMEQEKNSSQIYISRIAEEKKRLKIEMESTKQLLKNMAHEIESLKKIKEEKKEYEKMVNVFANKHSENALAALKWPGHGPEKGKYIFNVLCVFQIF